MHPIIFPSARVATYLRRLLDKIILSDIERFCSKSNAHLVALYDSFDFLKNKVECGDRYAVGAPLYFWLANVHYNSDCDQIIPWIDNLCELFVGQIIISVQPEESISILFPNPISHIPQANYIFPMPVMRIDINFNMLIVTYIDGKCFKICTNSIREMIEICKSSLEKIDGTDIFLHSRSHSLNEYIIYLNETASTPVNNEENLNVITEKDQEFSILKAGIKRGVELIIDSGQGRFEEVNVLIDAICLLRGNRFVGSSDIAYHGVAFLNLDVDWSPFTFADHLIHESAHILLHTSNEICPILKNPYYYGAPSPIRQDPRPMIGILHSTFVFMRLVMFFKHQVQLTNEDEVNFRLHRHLLGFIEGMNTLSKYASFTPEGHQLYAGMNNVLDWFKRTLPKPDPAFYKRIGNDYVV
ncbi:aKG-HExxH-type peptide beta-hydroxylase [Rheinheimera fenheensis]|uniref:aKG-HExxH-type peptide beta-hydroxylase n=1 Tax=Rheinheimera fenheensis TaxID=3152295 RepID=UPI0032604D33